MIAMGCVALAGGQEWWSGKNTRLPPVWPEFDSGPAPYVG